MTPREVERLAHRLLDQHELLGWRFGWDNAKKRFGCCNYSRRTITMSRHLTPHRTEQAVEQTLLHEIAHALVGAGHGHDRVWLAKARSIGYTGGTTSSDVVQVVRDTSRYVGTCSRCEIQIPRHRLSRGQFQHVKDGGTITFRVRAAA